MSRLTCGQHGGLPQQTLEVECGRGVPALPALGLASLGPGPQAVELVDDEAATAALNISTRRLLLAGVRGLHQPELSAVPISQSELSAHLHLRPLAPGFGPDVGWWLGGHLGVEHPSLGHLGLGHLGLGRLSTLSPGPGGRGEVLVLARVMSGLLVAGPLLRGVWLLVTVLPLVSTLHLDDVPLLRPAAAPHPLQPRHHQPHQVSLGPGVCRDVWILVDISRY